MHFATPRLRSTEIYTFEGLKQILIINYLTARKPQSPYAGQREKAAEKQRGQTWPNSVSWPRAVCLTPRVANILSPEFCYQQTT